MLLSRRTLGCGFAASLYMTATFPSTGLTQPKGGEFKGRVAAEWLSDGRRMKLIEPFEYRGADGQRWLVPAGAVVDGASIPQVFWSLIGGPFDGLYRGPSVVHDYYCDNRTRRAVDVHKVFHDSMLSAGVAEKRAWLMYQAVLKFGPQWPDPRIPPECQIVDENYDFIKCAQNSAIPSASTPNIGAKELRDFAKLVEHKSDPNDFAKLVKIIQERP